MKVKLEEIDSWLAYRKALSEAESTFSAAWDAAFQSYEEAVAPALSAHARGTESAWKAFGAAVTAAATAWGSQKEYDEAVETAREARKKDTLLDDIVFSINDALARKSCDEAQSVATKIYQEARDVLTLARNRLKSLEMSQSEFGKA